MRAQNAISRRHMLAMSAAGSLTIGGSFYGASAQAGKRIERLDPGLDAIIDTSQPIRELASGLGGELGPAEGPVWWKEGGYLLFSDIGNNRRMNYTPGQGVTVFKEKTNQANGLTRDLQGRLIACEHETRRVTRQELDGSITVIANSFQGRPLNRPNDVVVKSDGSIYFTDPNGNFVPNQWDLAFAGVYRVSADLGTMTLLMDSLTDRIVQPNGLAFSPDESVLYIIDSRRGQIRAFDVLPNGTLARQTDRVFADLRGSEPGGPDGMKVDTAGNVYSGGAGGIYILASPRFSGSGDMLYSSAYGTKENHAQRTRGNARPCRQAHGHQGATSASIGGRFSPTRVGDTPPGIPPPLNRPPGLCPGRGHGRFPAIDYTRLRAQGGERNNGDSRRTTG
jgi:gluconolactonase